MSHAGYISSLCSTLIRAFHEDRGVWLWSTSAGTVFGFSSTHSPLFLHLLWFNIEIRLPQCLLNWHLVSYCAFIRSVLLHTSFFRFNGIVPIAKLFILKMKPYLVFFLKQLTRGQLNKLIYYIPCWNPHSSWNSS